MKLYRNLISDNAIANLFLFFIFQLLNLEDVETEFERCSNFLVSYKFYNFPSVLFTQFFSIESKNNKTIGKKSKTLPVTILYDFHQSIVITLENKEMKRKRKYPQVLTN
jgi:hypothetical protein